MHGLNFSSNWKYTLNPYNNWKMRILPDLYSRYVLSFKALCVYWGLNRTTPVRVMFLTDGM